MKKFLSVLMALLLVVVPLTGCNNSNEPEETTEPIIEGYSINGHKLEEYTIVYSASDPDYTARAAAYIAEEIVERTGVAVTVKSDAEQTEPLTHEIVVGNTNRAISESLDISTEGFQFSMMADDAHIALEGDYFVIAAAAYYFVDTYIKAEPFASTVSKEESVYQPIVKDAKNYMFLIGDGMGFNQIKLFKKYSAEELGMYSDGESSFYGYMFPNQGKARTNSLSGTTDSAASGTALATGFKTINGYVGHDRDHNDVTSLTEIAISIGKSTAVMSTETLTGATPAAFSAHANSRNDTSDILADQKALKENCGTLILGEYGSEYTEDVIKNKVESDINNTLSELSKNENGFFIMYEEAYFDKHSHSNQMKETFFAGLRFNQAIGCFMEFAFYNPDTFVIITADHETGGLKALSDGRFYYTSTDHTGADVPVFAYGKGSEVFNDVTIENIQIPKTIAKMFGVDLVGYDDEKYPALVIANQE